MFSLVNKLLASYATQPEKLLVLTQLFLEPLWSKNAPCTLALSSLTLRQLSSHIHGVETIEPIPTSTSPLHRESMFRQELTLIAILISMKSILR